MTSSSKSKKKLIILIVVILLVVAIVLFVRHITADPLVGTWTSTSGTSQTLVLNRNGRGTYSFNLYPRTSESPLRWTRTSDYAVRVEIEEREGRPLVLEFEIGDNRIFLRHNNISGASTFQRED